VETLVLDMLCNGNCCGFTDLGALSSIMPILTSCIRVGRTSSLILACAPRRSACLSAPTICSKTGAWCSAMPCVACAKSALTYSRPWAGPRMTSIASLASIQPAHHRTHRRTPGHAHGQGNSEHQLLRQRYRLI